MLIKQIYDIITSQKNQKKTTNYFIYKNLFLYKHYSTKKNLKSQKERKKKRRTK